MGVDFLERELKRRRVLHHCRCTRCSGSDGSGRQARSRFMSELEKAAVAKAAKLRQPADALVHPDLAARSKRWLKERQPQQKTKTCEFSPRFLTSFPSLLRFQLPRFVSFRAVSFSEMFTLNETRPAGSL